MSMIFIEKTEVELLQKIKEKILMDMIVKICLDSQKKLKCVFDTVIH